MIVTSVARSSTAIVLVFSLSWLVDDLTLRAMLLALPISTILVGCVDLGINDLINVELRRSEAAVRSAVCIHFVKIRASIFLIACLIPILLLADC